MSYVETFMKEKPKAGLDIMINRNKRNRQVDEELAEFLKERALIEENYSKQLLKLSKKPFLTDRGTFSKLDTVWESLLIEVGNIAATHGQLGQSISRTVERPVREATNIHSESSHLRLIETNVQRLLKEYDEKTSKMTKLQKAVEKSKSKKNEANVSKITELSKGIEEVKTSLDSEMRRFYEQNEWVDRSRLDTVKKAISNYDLLQIEIAKQNTQMLEQAREAVHQFDTTGQLAEFCSTYRELNLSSNSLSTTNKLAGKIDSSGFGSWILRPRKNSGLTLSDSSIKDPSAASVASFGSNEVASQSQPSIAVDEEGYSIPPPSDAARDFSTDGEKDSDDGASESSSFAPAQKVKFDIREEAIKEDPNDIAKALTNISSTLRGPPSKRGPRGRRDRQMSDTERPMSTVHGSPTILRSPLSVQRVLRPASEYTSSNSTEPRELPITYQIIETVDAVKEADGLLRIQVTGEVKACIASHASTIQLQESIMSFSLNETKIDVQVNSQLIYNEDKSYRFHSETTKDLPGNEVVLFRYRAQTESDSEKTFLPFDLDTAFSIDEDASSIQFSFSAFPDEKISKVNQLRLGAKIAPEIKFSKTQPEPQWNPSARELIWSSQPTDTLNYLQAFGTVDGAKSLLLALDFDFLSSFSTTPIAWNFGRSAPQGAVLPSRAEYKIISGIFLINLSSEPSRLVTDDVTSQTKSIASPPLDPMSPTSDGDAVFKTPPETVA